MVKQAIPFRFSYIAMPLAILLLSVIAAAYFYRLLPPEVAYHFSGGAPDRWMGRAAVTALLLVPQSLFVLLAWAVALGAAKVSARFQGADSSSAKLTGVLALMGNMVALPQAILSFAMLDVFSYNSYQSHLMPLWLFALIVMVAGGIILGVLFIRAMWQALRQSTAPDESRRSDNK